MKDFPLRLRLTLWSVLVVAIGLLLFAISTGIHSYHEDVELIDTVLGSELKTIFSEVRHEKNRVDWNDAEEVRKRVPFGWRMRRMEIWERGTLRYRSPRLKGDALGPAELAQGNYSTRLRDRPLRLGVFEKEGWQLRLAMDMREPRASVSELVLGFLIALPVVLATTAIGGWWIARRALAPVASLTEAAEQITASDFEQRLPVPRNKDEIHRLTGVLNGMIERLETSFQQARRFSADASHELRTPLAVIRAGIESVLAKDNLSESQEKELLDLLDETSRLAAISEKLLLLSRADAGRLELDLAPTDLSALLEEAVDEARLLGENTRVHLDARIPPGVTVCADNDRIMQVLRNLLENAVKYNRAQGRVHVELTPGEQEILVRIENTGPTLRDDQKARIFERFYRGEMHRPAHGHGLGLNLAREIARAHGGEVALVSSEHDATLFELRLPREKQSMSRRAARIGAEKQNLAG
jgi:signal transduction histidine kinase